MKPHLCWWLVLAAFVGGLLGGRSGWPAWLRGELPGGFTSAAHAQEQPLPAPPESWLKGSIEEKFAQIERHLRGLDQSMAEIGYRYGELLIAAKTENWEYAKYQIEKIDLSLRLAIERRPKRAESAEPFLTDSIPPVLAAIEAQDDGRLGAALEQLHAGCVQCHQAENVLYFKESVDRTRARSS